MKQLPDFIYFRHRKKEFHTMAYSYSGVHFSGKRDCWSDTDKKPVKLSWKLRVRVLKT
ncbi:MAG TPA: hypothetical protein VMZ03_03800 [Chitinophagaceae bacterium]|nr:hypothetical protein [Chitinophagaceae bacterium]